MSETGPGRTKFDELASAVAELDMLAHTWGVEQLLEGAPTDDSEELEVVRSSVKNALALLGEVEQALAK